MKTRTSSMLMMIGVIAAIVGVLARQPVMQWLFPSTQTEVPSAQRKIVPEHPAQPALDAQAIALQRTEAALDWADAQSDTALAQNIHTIELFFGDAKQRTPAFCQRMLGLGSKCRLVADKMPLTRTDRHAQFIRQAFDEELFTPDQLRQATEQVAKNYAGELAGIENVMLVKLRADLGDLPVSNLPALQSDDRLKAAYEQSLQMIHQRAGSELKITLTRETMSILASEVLTLVAVRLGVSAGVLSAGAGTSWATLGVGLAVGLIVDQMITFVWDSYRDPAGELSHKINVRLDEIRTLVVNGDGTSPGLRIRLLELSKKRSEQRRLVIRHLIAGSEQVARVANP